MATLLLKHYANGGTSNAINSFQQTEDTAIWKTAALTLKLYPFHRTPTYQTE